MSYTVDNEDKDKDKDSHEKMFPSITNTTTVHSSESSRRKLCGSSSDGGLFVHTPVVKRTSECSSLSELNTKSPRHSSRKKQSSDAVDYPETTSTKENKKQKSKRRASSFSPALNQTKKGYRRVSTNSFDVKEVSNNVCPLLKQKNSKFRKDSIVTDNESVCGEIKPRRKSCTIISETTSPLPELSFQKSIETNDNKNVDKNCPKEQKSNNDSCTGASHSPDVTSCRRQNCKLADSCEQLTTKKVSKTTSNSKVILKKSPEKTKQLLADNSGDCHIFISPQAEVSSCHDLPLSYPSQFKILLTSLSSHIRLTLL